MNIKEEFEKWFYASKYAQVIIPSNKNKQIAYDSWIACAELMQAEIDCQAKELEALRGFANRLRENNSIIDPLYVFDALVDYKLIDEDLDVPTPLLTGK